MKEFNEFKDEWQAGRQQVVQNTSDTTKIKELARQKKRKSIMAHVGTIIVLTITLVILCLFFYYVAPFKTILSLTGVALMLGGLTLRIIVEIFSLLKANKLRLDYSLKDSNNQLISFYKFRTKIHGGFTLIIIALYCIGFYMLTPEFSLYINLQWMILMDSSFVVIAVILFWQLKKGVMAEKQVLKELVNLNSGLDNE
ncbi:hypothetical protein GCM10011506_19480 [Marivirga lumbricoides]|uniref:Uncharacterized protein n=1 Tax=Marivirga lumbricoides TaxID=1046115 RepID=A0ABQ1M457_9BACT|nr:hypothetical protein GCM10011506_19480 [Marivirga lumbricoides]